MGAGNGHGGRVWSTVGSDSAEGPIERVRCGGGRFAGPLDGRAVGALRSEPAISWGLWAIVRRRGTRVTQRACDEAGGAEASAEGWAGPAPGGLARARDSRFAAEHHRSVQLPVRVLHGSGRAIP